MNIMKTVESAENLLGYKSEGLIKKKMSEAKRMLAKDLIKALQKIDPDASVFVMSDKNNPIGFVVSSIAKKFQITLNAE